MIRADLPRETPLAGEVRVQIVGAYEGAEGAAKDDGTAVAGELDDLVGYSVVFGGGNAGIRHEDSAGIVIAVDQVECILSTSRLFEVRLFCEFVHQMSVDRLQDRALG